MLDWLTSNSKRRRSTILLICLILSVFLIPLFVKKFSQDTVKSNFLLREMYLRNMPPLSNDATENSQLLDRLTSSDRLIFTQCKSKKTNNDSILSKRVCSPDMDFMSHNESHPLTALASFPGSGNTWLRLLLEETAGLYTGSIYCDRSLKRAGFLGEGITSNSVLVTKTHNVNKLTKESQDAEYDSVVFLIRNPYDAIVSEANRKWGEGHLKLADISNFKNDKQWSDFVTIKSLRWVKMVRAWLNDDKPIIVVRYEDLKSDLSSQLERILSFLQTLYSQAQLQCVLDRELTAFKRNAVIKDQHKREHYYYTQDLIRIVELAIRSVEPILNRYGIQYD